MRHVQDQARVLGDARMHTVDVADLDIIVENDEVLDHVDQDQIENREGFDVREFMMARSETGFVKELGVNRLGKNVDVDKGRDGRLEIRSRLVARDFKVKGDGREFEVFAAIPL